MPSSPLAIARERLRTIAGALTQLSGASVILARMELADIAAWARLVPGDFYFLALCESALAPGGFTTPASIAAYLYTATDPEDGALDDLTAALRAQWLLASNYLSGEIVCSDVGFEAPVLLGCDPTRPFTRTQLTCYFAGF